MTKRELQILETFKHRVHRMFPGVVSEIVLFGSNARGDATDESDIDLLVVTQTDNWRTGDAIRRIGYELDVGINSKLSIQVVPSTHMDYLAKHQFLFYKNVHREGIAV